MLYARNAVLCFLLLIVLVATSCKSSAPEQTKFIPKDASVVLSINPKKISDKLADNKISLDSIMRSAFSEDTSMIITGSDIANSGINLSKDVYLFVNYTGSMMSGSSVTTGLVAALSKASSFADFVKKKSPSAQIKTENGYSYATLPNGFVVGWNDDVVLMDNVSGFNAQTGTQAAPADAAHQQLTALFSQKEEASLASVKQFKDASKEEGDMRFWSNSNGALASAPMISMSKASDLFKDTYTSGVINFENGKVKADLKTYPNAQFSDTLKKYAGPKVDMDLLKKYPGAVNGYALFSFDPKLIVSILNFAGFAQTANQFLQNQGYSLDDITKALKGDFAVVFSNFSTQKKEVQGYKYNAPTAQLVIDAAVGDKASYDKIMSQLTKQGLLVQQNGQYVAAMPGGFAMHSDAKNLVLATDSSILNQYVAGSGKASIPSDIESQSSGNAVAFYVDVAGILNSIPADSASLEMINSAKQTFKNVIATSDNYSNGVIKGHAELTTVNEKENSLATLTRYFGSLSEAIKKVKGATGTGEAHMELPDSSATEEKETPAQ